MAMDGMEALDLRLPEEGVEAWAQTLGRAAEGVGRADLASLYRL